MRTPSIVLLTALLSTSPLAQSARPSVQVNLVTPSNAGQVGVASDADVTVVSWSDTTTDEVLVAASDGRALSFAMPVRVDADAFSKTTQTDSVHVSGKSVVVVWEANGGLFSARSTDGGGSYSAPLLLDVGPGAIRDWRVARSGDHVYVACSTAVGDEDLYLTSSHDGGASFSAAVLVPSVGATGDVDALGVAADGFVVHVAWDDNRSGRDTVYYQRSADGGVTFLANDVPLGDNVGVEDSQDPLEIAVRGSTVAVCWNEEPTGSGNETIEVNVSKDGGASFLGVATVGGYTVGTHDTDEGHLGIDAATGNVIVAWEDNRSGSDRAYAAATADGFTWPVDVPLSTDLAEKPRVAVGARGTVVTWEGGSFPRSVESRLTVDGGLSFEPLVTVSDNAPDSVDFVTVAHGDRYGNFVHAWTSLNGSDFNVYAGGFRPQTLTPVGWVAGPTTVGFDLERFDPAFPFGAVLLSSSAGSFPLPFGDGRETGLVFDALFFFSIQKATGVLGTPIAADGSGSTPSAPITLSGPLSFAAVGYQFGFAGLSLVFGELSDVELVSL